MTDRWRSILFKLTEPFAAANRQQRALPLAELFVSHDERMISYG